MGSSESKQAASRLPGASLSSLKFPTETLILRSQKSLSLKLQLCDKDSNPLHLVTLPNGWSGDLILYGGVSKDNDAPLAVVTGVRGVHHAVRLAPPLPGGQIVEEELRMVGRGFLRVRVGYTFVLAGDGGARLPERFEWRGSKGEEVQSLGQRWHGWKLVRLGDKRSEGTGRQDLDEHGVVVDDDDDEEEDDEKGEVVAVWADATSSQSLHNEAAVFKFVGSGASKGGLGIAFRAMAIATFLRLWQLNSQNAGSGASASAGAGAAVAVVAAGV